MTHEADMARTKEFREWLNKNEVLHLFIRNGGDVKGHTIIGAFTWYTTPEGDVFWMRLADKLQDEKGYR